ncbi:MAG: hypothetical protein KF745_06890 [Phycisphaeraceae bacterium]|nr:hypothetical protein [Phycisphaeraceae bacterium]
MRIEGQNPGLRPAMPMRVANAYGVQPPAAARPVQNQAGEPAAGARVSTNTARLVAGVVPGGVEFGQETSGTSRMTMYRHPADRNAAATGVTLGRVLDLNG